MKPNNYFAKFNINVLLSIVYANEKKEKKNDYIHQFSMSIY